MRMNEGHIFWSVQCDYENLLNEIKNLIIYLSLLLYQI